MRIFDILSRRIFRQNGGQIPLQTKELPAKFRVQVVHILLDSIGKWQTHRHPSEYSSNVVWREIYETYIREYGLVRINDAHDLIDQCTQHIMYANKVSAMDFLEIALVIMLKHTSRWTPPLKAEYNIDASITAEIAIDEFNTRCIENGVGYQFVPNRIIEISSTYAHKEILEPAVRLLYDNRFHGAHDEFIRAFDDYRLGKYDNCIVLLGKSLESTIKTICTKMRWAYSANDTLSALVGIIFNNNLLPSYHEAGITHIRCLLQSNATVRNKSGAHGQGETPVEVPKYIAEFMMQQTAANINLLVNAYNNRAA